MQANGQQLNLIKLLEKKKYLIPLNLVLFVIVNIMLSSILFLLMDQSELKDWFTIFILLNIIITPFLLILTFIISLFWSLIGLFSKPDLQMKKIYSVILSCTNLYIVLQGLLFIMILNFGERLPGVLFNFLSLGAVLIVLFILYLSFRNFIGFSKRFSFISASILFTLVLTINLVQIIGGNYFGIFY